LAGFLMESPARHELTRQELEILRLLAEGCTNEAIGARLFLSAETVRTHVRRLMAKLNVHTRTAAVATALRERLIAERAYERAQHARVGRDRQHPCRRDHADLPVAAAPLRVARVRPRDERALPRGDRGLAGGDRRARRAR